MSLTPINDTLARATDGEPKPVEGMGATILLHSDRHAATIARVVRIGKRTRVGVRRDRTKVAKGSGQDGSAEYEFEPNPMAGIEWYERKDDEARWRPVYFNPTTNRWNLRASTSNLRIGERDEYRDPHI
jgi:hypothetical protein